MKLLLQVGADPEPLKDDAVGLGCKQLVRNTGCLYWQQSLEQRGEVRTQIQFLALPIEQLARVGSCLHRISKMGQPQKPNRVVEVFFASDVKRDPARVWNPSVLLGKAFRQESIAN